MIFSGVAVRHFLDVHAAFAGGDQGHLLRGAVGHQRDVVLLLDVGAVFDVQAAHLLAFGAGLVRLELHAQDFAGHALDVVDGLGHLHAAALAAATGVDLGLDHPHGAAGASSFCTVNAGMLRGTGTPKLRKISLPWYS
jgi:hypothetical protein